MDVEIQLKADLEKISHFFHNDKQFDPEVVISTTWLDSVITKKLHYDEWLEPFTVKMSPPNKPGLLLLSLYTTIANSRGVHCRLHAATGIVDVHKLTKDGFASAPVANYRATEGFAPLRMSVRLLQVPESYATPAAYKETNLVTLGGLVQADLAVFENMKPTNPFLLKCHVPVYRIANQVLPGAAFFSTHNTVDISHQWFVEMSAQVALRHGTTTAQWTRTIENQFNQDPADESVSEEFHEAVGMALEIATAAVQSYEYVVDFFVNTSGAHEMYESFDNYFARRCGDCEGKLSERIKFRYWDSYKWVPLCRKRV
jgi:hypothetical protein